YGLYFSTGLVVLLGYALGIFALIGVKRVYALRHQLPPVSSPFICRGSNGVAYIRIYIPSATYSIHGLHHGTLESIRVPLLVAFVFLLATLQSTLSLLILL